MLAVSPMVSDTADIVAKLRADGTVISEPGMLLGDIESLLGSITALQAVIVDRLRAAIATDATVQLTGRAPRAWLIEEQLLPGAEAARLVRLARRLPDAEATRQAFDAAEISTAHAAAVLTALATLPDDLRDTVEPHLVDRARTCPPEEIAGFTDQLLDRLGLDKASELRRERRHASRGIELARGLHGGWALTGTLTAEAGTKLAAALHTAGLTPTPPDQADDRTPRQRRHDALMTITDRYLATADTPPTTGAPRSVIVTMTLETLEARLDGQTSGLLPDGATVSPDTARRLACDAALIPAVLAGPSDVLDIGRPGHDFTTAIRRAAWTRDQGRCAFPRCANRPAELHHIHFRRHGGPASLHKTVHP